MKTFIFLSIFFLFAKDSWAESTATVKINTDVSSSSTSNVNVKNNIRIETDGKVTQYSSDKAENIEVKSENGISEIKVNDSIVQDTNQDNNLVIDEKSSTPSPVIDKQEKINTMKNFMKEFRNFFSKLFFFWR